MREERYAKGDKMKISLFERIFHVFTFATAGLCVSMIAFLTVFAIVIILSLLFSAISQSYTSDPYATITGVTAFLLAWAGGCYVVKRSLGDD